MANTSIREQLEKRLIISLSRLFIGKPYPDLGEIVDATMATLSAEFTPTADVAELVQAARVDELMRTVTANNQPKYVNLNLRPRGVIEIRERIAELQPPHKAEQ